MDSGRVGANVAGWGGPARAASSLRSLSRNCSAVAPELRLCSRVPVWKAACSISGGTGVHQDGAARGSSQGPAGSQPAQVSVIHECNIDATSILVIQ